jgi:hypothetical protein
LTQHKNTKKTKFSIYFIQSISLNLIEVQTVIHIVDGVVGVLHLLSFTVTLSTKLNQRERKFALMDHPGCCYDDNNGDDYCEDSHNDKWHNPTLEITGFVAHTKYTKQSKNRKECSHQAAQTAIVFFRFIDDNRRGWS